MNRIVASVTSLEQHVDVLENCPDVYRPSACPHCGIKRLWGHGYYFLKADWPASGEGTFNPIAICRYCCTHCRRTCSRLPLCIAPQRWYNWSVQQTVLARRLSGESVGACARCAAVAGRTVGRWWGWLQDRSAQLELGLRARESELGRAGRWDELWVRVFETFGLPAAMAQLDREMIVP